MLFTKIFYLSDTEYVFYFVRYLRAVTYRWLIRWLCGLLGWDNTRPLPACVYNLITKTYPTGDTAGYIPAEQHS